MTVYELRVTNDPGRFEDAPIAGVFDSMGAAVRATMLSPESWTGRHGWRRMALVWIAVTARDGNGDSRELSSEECDDLSAVFCEHDVDDLAGFAAEDDDSFEP